MTDDNLEPAPRKVIKLPEIKVTVLGNCGQEHASFEEWQKCKNCDSKAAISNKTGKQTEQVARNEREHDRIWNAAIEAAAQCSEQQNVPQFFISEQIRKLKK